MDQLTSRSRSRRDVFTGGPIDLGKYAAMRPAEWDHLVDGRGIKEIELARIQDEHYYIVRLAHDPEADKRPERLHQPYYITGRAETDRLLVRADTLQVRREPFSAESLVARLRTELPEVPIVEQQLLTEYDPYYYSRQHLTPLPVLRVKFADPGETWFYIDPSNSTHAVAGDASEPHRALAVQRPAQPRLPVLVRHASGRGTSS